MERSFMVKTKKQLKIYYKQLNQKQFKLKLSCTEKKEVHEEKNLQLKEPTQYQEEG